QGLESLRRSLAGAGEAAVLRELASEISGQVGRFLPHDGFLVCGMDPVTSVGSFHAIENGYSARTLRQMSIDFAHGRCTPLRVLAHGEPNRRHSTQLRNMAADGFGSEIRVELRHGGRTWGVFALL